MYTALFDIQVYRGSHCFFVPMGFRDPSSWENQEEYLVVPLIISSATDVTFLPTILSILINRYVG